MTRALMLAISVLTAVPASAGDPALTCQSSKNKEAGKYGYCRQKVEAKYATTGDSAARTAALQKCLDKYNRVWPALESKATAAGGACPSVSDQAAIQGVIDVHTTNIAIALAGGTLQDCPADLMTCAGDLSTCNTGLGTCTTSLTTCNGDLGTCNTGLGSCTAGLTTCNGNLTTCNATLSSTQASLTTCTGNLAT